MRSVLCLRLTCCVFCALTTMGMAEEVIGYDLATKTSFVVPLADGLRAVSGAKAGGIPDFPAAGRAFGSLDPIPTPAQFPYRIACKVRSTYAGQGTFEGAGILIGPKHCLTSGVYVHFNGLWASAVEVIPALDGDEHPYGSANGLQNFAWPDWVTNQDYDDNIGLILLDRPLGAIVGYHAYAGEDTDSFFTSNSFNVLGFPYLTETNGTQMHFMYGSFDSVSGNSLGFTYDLPSGLGGAGIYIFTASDQTRTVYGVMSHTAGPTAYAVRITESRASGIETTIDLATDTAIDLIALNMTGAGPTVKAGGSLDGLGYTLFNDSTTNFNAGFASHTYLSMDDTFDAGDTEIAPNQSGIMLLAGGATNNIASGTATIPRTTPPGDYYVLAQLDVTDSDDSNNATNGMEALPIEVTPLYHTADTSPTYTIDLGELLRVIQFYNSGAIYCLDGTEDGYSPTPGDQLCTPHDSDYDGGPSWSIELTELLRMIQFYNANGYGICDGTEDGFCPGGAP